MLGRRSEQTRRGKVGQAGDGKDIRIKTCSHKNLLIENEKGICGSSSEERRRSGKCERGEHLSLGPLLCCEVIIGAGVRRDVVKEDRVEARATRVELSIFILSRAGRCELSCSEETRERYRSLVYICLKSLTEVWRWIHIQPQPSGPPGQDNKRGRPGKRTRGARGPDDQERHKE